MAAGPVQEDQVLLKSTPEEQDAKIQNLEREVDLLKTSIKRLLMDIRERLNEMENPFVIASVPGGRGYSPDSKGSQNDANELRGGGMTGRSNGRGLPDIQMTAPRDKAELPKQEPDRMSGPQPYPSQGYATNNLLPHAGVDRRIIDDQLVAQFKAQAQGVKSSQPGPSAANSEKFRLQKVYKLFEWTRQAVRKYGNDRLEIILQSYRSMGYISKESFEEIKEVAKLMPANLGEEHEVSPDEYISELYMLNRIIAPDDISLDRDMIALMMEQRTQKGAPETSPAVPHLEFPPLPAKEKKPAKNQETEDDWMNLPDRI